MKASPFLRHRNAILVVALTVITLALVTVVTINTVEALSGSLGPACHRLLPRAPSLPHSAPWRLQARLGRHWVC